MKLNPIEILVLGLVANPDCGKAAAEKARAVLALHHVSLAHPDETENLTYVARSIIGAASEVSFTDSRPTEELAKLPGHAKHEHVTTLLELAKAIPQHEGTLKHSAERVARHVQQIAKRSE